MGGRGILDRQHHVDLVAFDRAGIAIDGVPHPVFRTQGNVKRPLA
jgi:hypothetical protein